MIELKQMIYLKNQKIIILSLLIFLIAFAVRFYKMPEYLFFGYEQGRDALVIQNISLLRDLVLVGPKTDLGGIFHGPFYYYLMAIPYGLSNGSPEVALIFIVVLGSLVPVTLFFLITRILNSWRWGLVASIISVFSFELIIYSRWLSNVSPAVLFVALTYLFLWLYIDSKKSRYFLISIILGALACHFEIILIIQFIFIYLMFFGFKVIKIPSFTTLILGGFILFLVFSPLILFDFRNQNISLNSAISFLKGSESKHLGGGFSENFQTYTRYIEIIIKRTLFNFENVFFVYIFYGILLGGVFWGLKDRFSRKPLLFFLLWGLMSLPLMLVSSGLDQLYVGSGLGFLGLLILSLYSLWQSNMGKILVFIVVGLLIFSFQENIENLKNNNGSFFVTIQEGLNYKDQRELLTFIHNDAENLPYQIDPITIPYLKGDAWIYLHKYFYPNDVLIKEKGKEVYIIIEPGVDKFWEDWFIRGHGESETIMKKDFGKIRLQKIERKES